jgi:EpsI family protein
MLVWHTYWINGRWTTNEYVAKAWQVWSQLTGHGDAAALVTVQTAMADDVDGAAALRLAEFFGAHGEGLAALLERAGARAVAEH